MNDNSADTRESHSERVRLMKQAGHEATARRELGWSRYVCATCGTDWPCPDMAEAQEWRG